MNKCLIATSKKKPPLATSSVFFLVTSYCKLSFMSRKWHSTFMSSCLFTCCNQTFVHMFFPLLPFYLWQSNNCSYVLPSPVFLPVAIKHLFICSSQSCVFTCGNQTFVHVLPSPVLLPVAIKHLFICSSQSCLFTCGNQTFVHVLPSPVFLPVAIKHLFICFYLWQSNICSYVLPSPVFVPVCGNQ
jgi:hypothetical protein